MTFEILKEFETETPKGTFVLKEGQKIRLSKEEAIPLIQDGLIRPVEKVAYKVYSEILQANLWVVDTDEDMHSLRTQGVTEAIYTKGEIRKLKGLSRDSLKEIHRAKEVFPESSIEEIKFKEEAKET
ncbi:MAG: hypothetical protein DDT19_02312 [Syntrophomonadaceae bacterium]|nr:hypothetical protein [Bacillota bacterium]